MVMVTAGKDRGRSGRVMRVITKKGRVVVEGINRVWKHVKPSQRNRQGGRIQKEAPLDLSNVMPIDPSTGKATRVRMEVRDGQKQRIARKSGTALGAVGKQ
jgi:large subunit ribosomal protein L24